MNINQYEGAQLMGKRLYHSVSQSLAHLRHSTLALERVRVPERGLLCSAPRVRELCTLSL
jgi:hypothetical protein